MEDLPAFLIETCLSLLAEDQISFFIFVENLFDNPELVEVARARSTDLVGPSRIRRHSRAIATIKASLRDPQRFDLKYLLGAKQITYIYLLSLACQHGMKLVTFDANINLQAVKGATADNLEIL